MSGGPDEGQDHRYAADATVTASELCRSAVLAYGMLDARALHSPARRRRAARGPERHNGVWRLYVDVSHVAADKLVVAREILKVLAFDLDCYESGKSLVLARLAEPLIRGGYVPYGTATDRRDTVSRHKSANDKTVPIMRGYKRGATEWDDHAGDRLL